MQRERLHLWGEKKQITFIWESLMFIFCTKQAEAGWRFHVASVSRSSPNPTKAVRTPSAQQWGWKGFACRSPRSLGCAGAGSPCLRDLLAQAKLQWMEQWVGGIWEQPVKHRKNPVHSTRARPKHPMDIQGSFTEPQQDIFRKYYPINTLKTWSISYLKRLCQVTTCCYRSSLLRESSVVFLRNPSWKAAPPPEFLRELNPIPAPEGSLTPVTCTHHRWNLPSASSVVKKISIYLLYCLKKKRQKQWPK